MLTAAGVSWCLLRPPATPDDDVDVLVASRGDLHRAVAALAEQGYRRPPRREPAGHVPLVRPRPQGGWDKVDLVTEVRFGAWGQRRLPAAPAVVAAAGGDPPRPAPADELWLLALHHLLDKDGPPPAARRHRLRELAAAVGTTPCGPVGEAASARVGADELARGLEALVGDDEPGRRRAAARLAARWRPARLAVGLGRLRRKWDRLPVHSARRGLSCAVLGPDGAGKSTLTEALVRTLPLPTRRIYLGYPTGRARWPLPGRTFLPKARTLARGSFTAQRQLRSGGVVVFDRYGDDLVETARPGTRRRWANRLLGVLRPRLPDLVVILDAPPEVMFARKGEHDLAELARRRRHYLHLAETLPQAVRVDAAQPADEVLATVTTALWDVYRRRQPR